MRNEPTVGRGYLYYLEKLRKFLLNGQMTAAFEGAGADLRQKEVIFQVTLAQKTPCDQPWQLSFNKVTKSMRFRANFPSFFLATQGHPGNLTLISRDGPKTLIYSII